MRKAEAPVMTAPDDRRKESVLTKPSRVNDDWWDRKQRALKARQQARKAREHAEKARRGNEPAPLW
ncbi:MAG: hypothetical protein OXM02_09240 [Bacteroidota bacterium]|nr:hypothetical protein [Bacteroidota bacterium]